MTLDGLGPGLVNRSHMQKWPVLCIEGLNRLMHEVCGARYVENG